MSKIVKLALAGIMVVALSACGGGSGGNGSNSGNDTTRPVITLKGDASITIEKGETFADPGVTATDDVDGAVNVATSGTVDNNTTGIYTLTYTATDQAGNVATKSRSVEVVQDKIKWAIDHLYKSTQSALEKFNHYTPKQDFSYGKEFFVSTTGDDNNDGTIDSPFATLAKAKCAVRDYKQSNGIPDGGIVVWFRGGTYHIVKESYLNDETKKLHSNGIVFTAEDSGKEGSPIAYRGYQNEKVRLMGAVPIPSAWFDDVNASDPLWDRLDTDARDHIKVVNLKEHGIENIGEIGENHYASNTPLELFDDTVALDIAR